MLDLRYVMASYLLNLGLIQRNPSTDLQTLLNLYIGFQTSCHSHSICKKVVLCIFNEIHSFCYAQLSVLFYLYSIPVGVQFHHTFIHSLVFSVILFSGETL